MSLFDTKVWINKPNRTTALDAEGMNDLEQRISIALENTKGYVNHGAVAGTARPSGYVSVEWVGSVEPTNAINGDTWINTT